MIKILCTGIATLDIVNEVIRYPAEDDEIRIVSQHKRRGGNAANTAVVLSQLGYQCYWAGTLVDEIDSQTILNDLQRYKINYEYCQFLTQGKVPTSYITLSRETGSRTISHFRDLPEYTFEEFKKINLELFDWFHFEGRNIEQTMQMMAYCKNHYPDTPISVELEKRRNNSENLIHLANIVLFSRHYALLQGFSTAENFCRKQNKEHPEQTIICAWGETGAAASRQQQYYWQHALSVDAVDTLAAGDVFNAGIIDQQIKQQSIAVSLAYACQLAGTHCTRKGIDIL